MGCSLPGSSIHGIFQARVLEWVATVSFKGSPQPRDLTQVSHISGKDPDAGRDWGQEEKGTTEDEITGWHHQLDAHEFE